MPFVPQQDYDAYNSAVAKQLQSRTEPSIDEKLQKYVDFYNALIQARRQLGRNSTEVKMQHKREKLQRHVRLVQVFNALDRLRDEK